MGPFMLSGAEPAEDGLGRGASSPLITQSAPLIHFSDFGKGFFISMSQDKD